VAETISGQARAALWRTSVGTADALLLSSAILLAPHLAPGAAGADGAEFFSALAASLPKRPHWDALDHAAEWLADPPLSSEQMRAAADALRPLLAAACRTPIDWDTEANFLFQALGDVASTAMPLGIARALVPLLDIPSGATCACVFSASTALAWQLAGTNDVRLHASEIDIARAVAVLAFAAGRPLTLDRRNPIDGSFMPVGRESWHGERDDVMVDEADYLVSVPPIGMRVVDQAGRKAPPYEGRQIVQLLPKARRALLTLVPDGPLFREGRSEVELRKHLVERTSLTVASLPAGLWGRHTSISTSLLRVQPGGAPAVSFVDLRRMGARSVGRVQDRLVAQHLAQWRSLADVEPARCAEIPVAEVSANGWALLPDRYVRHERLAALDAALDGAQAVSLEEVAAIERPKAPRPLLDGKAPPALLCREIAPADIVEGLVRRPRRTVAFDADEAGRARKVAVRGGDLVVSIKGNVGIVGQVPAEADLADAMGEPWIVSQSLAIVRLKPNALIASADALAAIVSAPFVRERLESLSGGSIIATLPMSALRGLPVPIPPAEELARADAEMAAIEEMRHDIARRTENLAERRRALWSQLWNVNFDMETHDA
jgi:hypothetical protein